MKAAYVEVVEYTDPICSWAWGTEPKLRLLRWRHEHRCRWRRVMGGLVGDASKGRAEWDRVSAAASMSDYWRRTSAVTGQPYPKPMHIMLRSTHAAGRAVKAAERQGDDVGERVLRRLREAIFVFGRGPETEDELAAAAEGVAGLDVERWRVDLRSPEMAAAFQADWEETRRPNEFVRTLKNDAFGNGAMKHSEGRDRYAFSTLLFHGPGGDRTVAGWMPYQAYVDAMEGALPGSTGDARADPTAAEALERWGMLTAKELAVLCGEGTLPPSGAVEHDWGDGVVYFSPPEAALRGLLRR